MTEIGRYILRANADEAFDYLVELVSPQFLVLSPTVIPGSFWRSAA
jgi:hypothetical protein